MPKRGRWLLRLLLLTVVLIAAVTLLLPLVPLSPLKPAVESRLSSHLGREIKVGSLRLNLLGGPYLIITEMYAKEDPAFGGGNFLEAHEVRANLSLMPLLVRRQINIESLTIESTDLTLVKSPSGVWSWTTLGRVIPDTHQTASNAQMLLVNIAASTTINNLVVEQATVKLVDQTGGQPPESIYRNVALEARINRESRDSSRVVGQVRVQSDESSGGELFRSEMPFDLTINRGSPPGLSVKMALGPGPIETKNFSARSFKLVGDIKAESTPDGAPQGARKNISTLTGSGHISSDEVFITGVNISERVATALSINQIGDMNPGTAIGSLETDFQIDQGTVNTNNLRIEHLDGLGDATAPQGWFKVEAALVLNYKATVLLSADATSKVKSSSPIIGAAVSILERNNRVDVPVNIAGDVRNPEVRVDVSRLLRF